jgi:phosphoribosylformylglycinamidine synthase
VTGDSLVRVREAGVVVAEIPGTALTDEAPQYNRPMQRPADLDRQRTIDVAALKPRPSNRDAALALLTSPTVASKRWIFRQYDSIVRTNTLVPAGYGTPVVRVKESGKALAISTDANGRFVLLDPKEGAMLAVAEASRNVAIAGAVPIGVTNNLNFGNPERPEIMWQLGQAVAGIGEACRAFEIPVTGGNVSLYNETDGRAILPTPVIGVVGLLEDASAVVDRRFRGEGRSVILMGEQRGELGGSEYLKTVHGQVRGVPPRVDLARERAVQQLLPALVRERLIESAHDVSDGGLAITLAECCFDTGGVGVAVDVPAASGEAWPGATGPGVGDEQTLFGESAPLVVVSAADATAEAAVARAIAAGVPARVIGRTGGAHVRIAVAGREALVLSVAEAEQAWGNAIEARMTQRRAGAA